MQFVFKSTIFKVLTLFSVLMLFILFNFNANCQVPVSSGLRKVVIDPGHGGSDPGTIGSRTQEKNIALSIALKVGDLIKDNFNDIDLTFTRKDDRFVPLDERTKIANSIKADIFISIHCNANPSKNPYGAETYVLGLHKSEDNLDVAMRENAVIAYEDDYSSKYEGYDPKSTESFIIFNLMQNAYLDQSLKLANNVQNEIKIQARRFDRGVKQAGFLVLWKTSMPSILIEVGFLSNIREEAFLASKEGQDQIASSIFKAFSDYKRLIDNHSSFTSIVKSEEVKEDTVKPDDKKVIVNDNKADIVFKIQVKSSKKRIPITPKNFKNYKGVDEIKADGIYKYTIGSKRSYSEIVELCQQVKKSFPGAFIIALKGGVIVPVDSALKELSL